LSACAAGQHAAMVRHDQNDERLREAQEDTGYGEDEGERDDALTTDEPAPADDRDG